MVLAKELIPVEGYGITLQILNGDDWEEKGFNTSNLVHWDANRNICINSSKADFLSINDINMAILLAIGDIMLEDKSAKNIISFAANIFKAIYKVDDAALKRIMENISPYMQ